MVRFSTEQNWQSGLPSKDWLCIIILNGTPRRYIDEAIPKILDKDVCCICTVGPESEMVHDLIDEEIVYREVVVENLHLPQHPILTTWHKDLDEGIWFGIFAARHDEVEIKDIIILDLTGGSKSDDIQKALKKVSIGE